MQAALNVLLLEDSEDDAELVSLELYRGGLKPNINRVDTEDGFVQSLRDHQYDLILSDYNLPHFNAPRALEIFKSFQKDLPFIILSGAVEAEDVVALLKAGAHDFLEKNDLARLVPAIERELREVNYRFQQKHAEQTLQKLFRAIEQSPLSMMLTDAQGRVEYVNPTFEKNSGQMSVDVIGELPDVLQGENVSLEKNAEIWDAIEDHRQWRGEFCNERPNGEPFWEYITIAPILNEDGALTNLSIAREDITYRKDTEEKLYREAHFDKLTGLPNRKFLLDNLDKAISQHNKVAFLILDFNDLGKVNESLGHETGDQMIIKAAQRIEEHLPIQDVLGRMSGSKFGLIHTFNGENNTVEKLISELFEAFDQQLTCDHQEIFLSLNFGVALYPQDGLIAEVLLKNADTALNEARKIGGNQFCFFSYNLTRKALDRLSLEGYLRKSILREELVLFYQPIIDAKSMSVCGAEALIRWNHPQKGLLTPDRFITLAEESGMIVSIGQWVMNQAFKDLKTIQALVGSDFYMAINISPPQIWSSPICEDLATALSFYDVDPKCVQVEMTESVCLHDENTTLKTLQKMAEMGVKIAVDDFGTGYSSLSYLKRYPFTTLKIDRSFVKDLPDDCDDVALIDAMFDISERLGLKVVAEGVEDEAQIDFLNSRNCDLLQGYHFSKPIPMDAFINYLNAKPA